MKYRAEIDGLRALAVVPVILFHAGFDLFSGGFVGVDVFFVISGYLITTILIEDIENKRFSIINFYERRARRILPALFFMMLVCIPFAWMWMIPSQMKDFSQSLVAVNLFASNILFWQESGYFAEAVEEKLLLHTWSLAVEEQYYLLFPIFLLFAWRFGKNRVFWMIIALTSISLLLSEWGWRHAPDANFYLAPTRAWELLAGSITAFIVQRRGVQTNNWLSLLGLTAIIFSIFIYDEHTPFPSIYTLVPVVGVVLLILFADKNTIIAKLLSARIFVAVGLISYSAYLWHQPLFAFARIKSLEAPSAYLMGMLSVASLLLAVFSWKYIEKPFRNKNKFNRNQIFAGASILFVLFTGIGLAGHFSHENFKNYWLSKQPISVQKTYWIFDKKNNPAFNNDAASADNQQVLSECRFNVEELNPEINEKLKNCYTEFGSGILILGDSHAIDLFGVVASRFDDGFIVGVTKGGCRPHTNHAYCHYNGVKKFIETNADVFKRVIYEQAGFYLLKEADGRKGSREMFSEVSMADTVDGIVIDEEHIRGTIKFLEELSKFVSIKWFLSRAEPHIHKRFILRKGCDYDYQFRPNQYKIFLELDSYIQDYVKRYSVGNIQTISQNKLFVFDLRNDFMNCEQLFWGDGDHFSADGEVYFGKRLPDNFLQK